MRALAILCLLTAGCISDHTVYCEDGSACPQGRRCAKAGFGTVCVAPEELDACAEHAELEGCAADKRCYRVDLGLVCLVAGCANGFVDPGEMCDDHNNINDDQCSADCSSNNTCGNTKIDLVRGEQCDDGDHVSHDGCSSDCLPERPRWANHDAGVPRLLSGPQVAFDPRRGRIVLFGGQSFVGTTLFTSDQTYEWTGTAWAHAGPLLHPAPRTDAAIAYDDVRHSVVMFGGTGEGILGDTWEWTGDAWNLLDPPAPRPSSRNIIMMANDPARHHILMFGGQSADLSGTSLGDTWLWDGTRWTEDTSSPHPPATSSPWVVYDAHRGVTVVIANHETWEYTDHWTRGVDLPSLTVDQNAAFDPTTNTVVGITNSHGVLGVYSYDGIAWTLRDSAPTMRSLHALVADTVHGRLVAIGTNATYLSLSSERVEVWDGQAWTPLTKDSASTEQPAINNALYATAAALVPASGLAMLFGGLENSVETNQTWRYDGVTWTQVFGAAPQVRHAHAMAYDAARDEVVMFGGLSGTVKLGDTWVWNPHARTWMDKMVAGPPARAYHVMAFDPARGTVILFGGSTIAGLDGETWEWNGTTWTRLMTAHVPQARRDAAFAFDPIANRLVLFGGGTSVDSGPLGSTAAANAETWTFDGDWHQEAPVVSPPRRFDATLTWDPDRARLVLVGGTRDTGGFPSQILTQLDDAWEWDGDAWHLVVPTTALSPRSDHVAFSSPLGSGIVVVGGNDFFTNTARSAMQLRWDQDGGTEETCVTRADQDRDGLVGCADPDCWAACTPSCPPGVTCPTSEPRCGDGACSPLENPNICPADCGPPAVYCGDLVCDPGEDCAADCHPP